MSIYCAFGVRPVINGVGPATRLGGTIMADEVLAAMAEAAKAYVKIDELQEAAGKFIADLTGADSAYVTSGAAAGLALATATSPPRTAPRCLWRPWSRWRIGMMCPSSSMPLSRFLQPRTCARSLRRERTSWCTAVVNRCVDRKHLDSFVAERISSGRSPFTTRTWTSIPKRGPVGT